MAKKAREEKQDADTKAVADSITLKSGCGTKDKDLRLPGEAGQETATARGRGHGGSGAVAHGLAMEEKSRPTSRRMWSGEQRNGRDPGRGAVRADKRIQLEQETTFAINKMNEDAAKETADRQAKMLEPFMELISTVFDAFDRALSTSVTGIIQGTVTLKPRSRSSQSIGASLVEGIIKDGLDLVREGIKEFLEAEMVKDLLQMRAEDRAGGRRRRLRHELGAVQLSGAGMDLNTYGSAASSRARRWRSWGVGAGSGGAAGSDGRDGRDTASS